MQNKIGMSGGGVTLYEENKLQKIVIYTQDK